MANSDTPYRRLGVGANSWEDLLDQVNEELQNPPEDTDCEPIEPIEVPDENHIWAKSDIREVHDKLNEMPTDCFDFDDIPDLWKVSIIDNIEEQLSNSWCDCEEDEICCEPCGNAGSTSESFVSSSTSTACDTPCKTGCPFGCEENNCVPDMDEAFGYHNTWQFTACEFCDLYEQVKELEEELEALEEKYDNCPEGEAGDQCRFDTQQEIDEKQEELDEKTAERDAKKAEKDSAYSSYNSARGNIANCLAQCCTGADPPGDPCINLMSSTSTAIDPGDDETCEGYWNPCCGCNFIRCVVLISLQRKTTSVDNTSGQTFESPWETVYSGYVDKDGNVAIRFNRFFGCCCTLEFTCCCTATPGPECEPGACNTSSCKFTVTEDWREIYFPPRTFTPFDCEDGTPCDGEAPEGPGPG